MALSKQEYIRDLDATEQFVDACMVHRNICLAGSVSFKTKQAFKFEDIQEALVRFQKNNFQLQLTIKRTSGGSSSGKSWNPLRWIKTPKAVPKVEFWTVPNAAEIIPFQWIKLKSNEPWETSVIENEIQATFKEGQLLWRAFYIDKKPATELGSQEGTIVLVFHSAITDNIGLNLLLDYFLAEFDDVLNGTPFNKKETKMLPTLIQIFDKAYIKPNTWGETLKIWKDMMSCMLTGNRSAYLARNPLPIIPEYTTRHIMFNITKEQSTKLLQSLKKNDISIRGLITASGLGALHEMISNSKDEVIKAWTTHEVNVRVFCQDFDKLKGRIDGCRCTYMETPFDAKRITNSSDLWALATLVHGDVQSILSSEFQAKLCLWFENMGSPYGFFGDMGVKTYGRNDMSVAVYDNLDDVFRERENIQVNQVFGTCSAHNLGSPFKHVIHVFKGQIYYTVLYSGNFVKYEQAKEYGEKTLSYLQMATE